MGKLYQGQTVIAAELWERMTTRYSSRHKQNKFNGGRDALCKILAGHELTSIPKHNVRRLGWCLGYGSSTLEVQGGTLVLTSGQSRAELNLWDVHIARLSTPQQEMRL